MKLAIIGVIIIAAISPAKAQDYEGLAKFAEKICGDIPSGSLTRTQIQGAVRANTGVLSRIIGGSGDVSASRQEEIYNGIPFDKLPNNIPTVSMCKSELMKIILARRESITCRHPDFGQVGWRRSENYTDSSSRVGGGHDQNWWCNRVVASFLQSRQIGSQYASEVVRSHEEDNKNWRGRVTYKYHCTVRISWVPLYAERKDPRCGFTQ